VDLDELAAPADAELRLRGIAEKTWASQKDVDALRRALRDLRGLEIAHVSLATAPAHGQLSQLRAIGDAL
jgi:hypothetical protein